MPASGERTVKALLPPYIVALETEALIALAITLHLAKR
ncbi:hypothetical protein FHX70_002012 [Slackia isoflavoniconvertens]|nr:hypothetical protein [Slackia isoflavoniconvertens]